MAQKRERNDGGELAVLAVGDKEMLMRPCVDCGVRTGSFCDYSYAKTRVPNEVWAEGQMTPLCNSCDNQFDECHFCRGLQWCTPKPR